MSSTYGKKRGFPDFDKFKSGLTYQDAVNMLWVESENQDDWKRKSPGMILRILHRLKIEMYEQATGINVDRDAAPTAGELKEEEGYPPEWDDVFPEPRTRSDGRQAVRKEICHRGHRFAVTYWIRPDVKPAAHPANRVPVKKVITHRGRHFEVTYWKKAC